MAQAQKSIDTVIVQLVRKAGEPGLRIGEIVKSSRRNREEVKRALLGLRATKVLKMTGVRRGARYTIKPKVKARA